MKEPLSTTALPSVDDPETAAIRKAMIGDRVTLKATAKAMGVCERTLYYAVQRNPAPYIVVFGRRFYEPADLARAVVAERNAEKRGRGRPRKNAA
ncbi:MAG TPA: hypothetical protein VND19_18750 [Acetobacteraceae bacterium]|nr:hypothetical protein [Acetobacteraceae bacterium]